MKLTSAEANKMIRALKDQYRLLFSQEENVVSFIAATTENVEEVRPSYSYEETAAKYDEIERKIRKAASFVTFSIGIARSRQGGYQAPSSPGNGYRMPAFSMMPFSAYRIASGVPVIRSVRWSGKSIVYLLRPI